MIDLMDEFEIGVGVHPMLEHEAAQAGAVALVEVLLDAEGIVGRDAEKTRDVGADAVVDLLPQVEMMGIQRVVEVEHPCLHMGEAASGRGRCVHRPASNADSDGYPPHGEMHYRTGNGTTMTGRTE